MRLILALLGCFFLSLFLALPGSQGAEQTKTAPQTGDPKQAPPPTAIADSEIIPRAEQALRSLQDIRSQVVADRTLGSIERDFAAFAETSDRRRESAAETMSKSRSVQRVNEILREWNIEQSQLEDWDQALTRRSESLGAQVKRIDQIVATWVATQAAVAKKLFFKSVLERRVNDVLTEAQATRVVLQEHTTRLLKLQSQLADRLANLAKVRKEIDEARKDFGRSLFRLDSPPLWQALFGSAAHETILAEASDSPQKILSDWQDFVQKYGARIPWHLAFFLALVMVFYFLRRSRLADAGQKHSDDAESSVLARPFSASLLLALIPSVLFYPGAPAGVLRTAMAPSMISVISLLPGFLPQKYQRWVRLLVVLYLLEFLRSLLPEDWLLTRVLLLVIAAVGGGGIGWFVRSRAPELSVAGSRERLVLLGVRIGLILLIVSALSNVVGNMILAEILAASLVRISYAAAVIFASAHLMMVLAGIAVRSRSAQWSRSVRTHGALIGYRCSVAIGFVAVITWVIFGLYVVGLLEDVSAAGAQFLELRWHIGAAEISIKDVAAFVVVFFSALIFSRLLRFVLTEEILPRIRLPRGAPGAVDVLARYGVLLLGFFIALAAAGVDLSKVTLLISALGVGIGFGLQNLVNNFVSGLILVFEHPVQVGDHVDVSSLYGQVRKIGFRASILRTPDGADVIVPNSELIGSRVINWSLTDQLRRISIPVSVAYGTDPNRVMDILMDVARKHPAVLAHPAPIVVFDRFAESALNCTLLCWSSVEIWFLSRSELTIAINNAFKEAGIQIPFPQQDVHLHWPDGSVPGTGRIAQREGSNQLKSDKDPPFIAEPGGVAKK